MHSFGGLSSARKEGSYNSTQFVESLKTFPLTSGNFLLLNDMAFREPIRVRVYANSVGAKLLFITRKTLCFIPIEGVFCILKSNDHSTGRIAETFSTR
jgi:hypothetical protein